MVASGLLAFRLRQRRCSQTVSARARIEGEDEKTTMGIEADDGRLIFHCLFVGFIGLSVSPFIVLVFFIASFIVSLSSMSASASLHLNAIVSDTAATKDQKAACVRCYAVVVVVACLLKR